MKRLNIFRNFFVPFFGQALPWLALCGACVLFVFKVKLHSDILFFDDFMEDIINFHGSFLDWRFPPAPAFFPEITVYTLAYLIFDSVVARVAFVGGIEAVLLALLCIYLADSVRPKTTNAAKSLIVFLVAIVAFSSLYSDMWFFFHGNNTHFSSILCSLVGFSCLIRFLRSHRLRYLISLSLAVFLGAISSSLIVLTLSAPIIILLMLWSCVRGRKVWRFSISGVVAIFMGHILAGFFLSSLVLYNGFDGRVQFSIASVQHSTEMLGKAFVLTFAPDNTITLLLSSSFLIVFAWLLIEAFRRVRVRASAKFNGIYVRFNFFSEDPYIIWLLYYWLITFFITFVGSILSGVFADPYCFRYFSLPICIGTLLRILLLDIQGALEKRMLQLLILMGMALLVVSWSWHLFYDQKKDDLADIFSHGEPYLEGEAACLKKLKDDGVFLGAGIGDYWDARGLRYRLNDGTYILPVTNDGNIFFHIMNLGQLLRPIKYAINQYNFVILHKMNTQSQFNLTPKTLGLILPHPDAIYSCPNSDREVWIYFDEVLDHFVKKNINQFLLSINKSSEIK